jgi:phage tail sheath protein FI
VLEHCAKARHRFAVLDPLPGLGLRDTVAQWQELKGVDGALYYPWLRVPGPIGSPGRLVPPSGHVAGVYNRTDRAVGVFKSPANTEVLGSTDLEFRVTTEDQEENDPEGVVNCVRPFTGRGIRIWGARTISGQPDWKYIAVRRLYLTIARWIETRMGVLVLEPNGPMLWARIRRETNEFLAELFRAGAFQGRKPEEAYFVECGEKTSTEEQRDAGAVIVEAGFAPATPNEFVIVRFVHGAAHQQQ